MRDRPIRTAVIVALQLALLWHQLARGGIPERRRRSSGDPPPPSSSHAGGPAPTRPPDGDGAGAGADGVHRPPDAAAGGRHQKKSNDSPKGETETQGPGLEEEKVEEEEEERQRWYSSQSSEGGRDGRPLDGDPPTAAPGHNATASTIGSSSSSDGGAAPSAGWPTMSPSERLARLAMLKRTVLDLLGLERPPNITRPLPDVPPELVSRLQSTSEYQRTLGTQPNDMVIFAEEERADCGPSVPRESCFAFTFSEQVVQSPVTASYLWVYVSSAPAGASIYASRPAHHYGGNRHVLAEEKLHSREGWVELEIPVARLKWNRRRHYLEIGTKGGGNLTGARSWRRPGGGEEEPATAATAATPNRRPMLLLSVREDRTARGRPRRSVGLCSAGQSSCCMRTFEVHFADIGWNSWIVSPTSIDANYCSGTCGMASRNFLHEYSEMIAVHESSNVATPDTLEFCCVPDDIGLVNIMFHDDENNVKHRLVPLVVRNCGCV